MELVDVAERMFLERGFAETTMQMIAEAAGASKETLYRHFSSKEQLFAGIVDRKARELSGPDSALARGGAPATVLFDLGAELLTMVLRSPSSSLFRILVAEAPRTPELGDLFYKRGPGRTVRRLAAYLAAATERGELRCSDPQQAARLYLGAVVSQYHLHCLVQPNWKRPSEREVRDHVESAVAMFLAMYDAS
ncbi:TetR/AcrR family transcriptional regulator [Bradyrhizobium genosp. L]|uniref:TetR/AcrR family transcriptional regulator n=1 Tax=Bradyrhizobium genosp. L TaxID=83637 RepID=UPI0018A28EAC|nr:TetR/AcrR family transcriptional regulator [Bradyrhizobium genosp. L]QPF81996.1 TetR/AcrR family transcriptional regulator [Bradyrhizobium genosp. L]